MFLLTNPDLHHGLLGAKIESLRCMANKDADECFPSSMYAPNWATILIFRPICQYLKRRIQRNYRGFLPYGAVRGNPAEHFALFNHNARFVQ